MIDECRKECEEGKMDRMYKVLNDLGMRSVKVREGLNVTVSDFKEHFQKLSYESNVVDPRVIEGVVVGTRDLRESAVAVLGNDSMNARIQRDEIECAIREIRDLAPGKDRVYRIYKTGERGSQG